jgi:shikimate kinase
VSETRRTVFLVGFMGTGKSSVGACLAELLGVRFVDTDALVEREEGRSVERIFRESGEDHFRQMERRVLRELDSTEPLVVATGGGLFTGEAERSWMNERGHTVWLDVPLDELRKRIGEGSGRPLWKDDAAFLEMFETRKKAYRQAHHRVDAGHGSPEEIARRILEMVQS